jgi:uroporphyrin-III C-methyltransferase / precorrin-2 dehydrogenase / sirohydrochlorin ferrochelatase
MYLPLMFKSNGMRVLLVGGGEVAARKLELLSAAKCAITIISPSIHESLKNAVTIGDVDWMEREFCAGDCIGYPLIIAATENRAVNQEIYAEAVSLGIPINVVDDPELCTVIFPAVWRHGSLNVSVSTEGGAPFMASAVRNRLAVHAAPFARWAEIAAEFRTVVRSEINDWNHKNRMYRQFVDAIGSQDPPDPPASRKLEDWLAWLSTIVSERK